MSSEIKIVFILGGLVMLACILGFRPRISPALISGSSPDADAMVLGESGMGATSALRGPDYLTSNVQLFFPPPLMHLNPVTSYAIGEIS